MLKMISFAQTRYGTVKLRSFILFYFIFPENRSIIFLGLAGTFPKREEMGAIIEASGGI